MRWVRRAMLSLVLGFMTTVAVAWAIAAWLPQKDWAEFGVMGPVRPDDQVFVFMTEHRARGATRRGWSVEIAGLTRRGQPFAFNAIATGSEPNTPVFVYEFKGLKWGTAPGVVAKPSEARQDGCEHATGWPLLAAWYAIDPPDWNAATSTFPIKGGIELFQPPGASGRFPPAWAVRALPIRPIWLGLAANTAIYAVCWFALITSVVQARRTLRRRRGRCVRCAYDLSGLAAAACCPECGYRVASPRTSTGAQHS